MPSFVLAQDEEHFRSYLDSEDWDVAGLDEEDTSLDTRKSRLTGFSISINNHSSMYVPTGHKIGKNLDLGKVLSVLKAKFDEERPGKKKRLAVMWYLQHDLNVWQANTGWVPSRFLDGMELVYLNDPDRKKKGLKLIAKEELGVDMEKFTSLFSQEEIDAGMLDISTKSPERCTEYASSDAFYTRQLFYLPKFQQVLEDHSFPVQIDTEVADVIRKVEHNGGMEVNPPYIMEQLEKLARLEKFFEEQIYRFVGRQFEISSPKQLGIALFEWMGIPNVGKTHGKNPIYNTSGDDLDTLKDQHPVIDSVIAYRKILKARTTYFEKLKYLADHKVPVRFNFNIYSAPTFRFSAPGGDPDVDGCTGINIQAVSNGEVRDMWGVDLSQESVANVATSYEIAEEESLVAPAPKQAQSLVQIDPEGFKNKPWVVKTENESPVCLRNTCDGCNAGCKEKGFDVTRRIVKNVMILPSVRQGFKAPEGYTLVSFDYTRQELVIGANLSKDPIWLKALKENKDLHEQTAADCFLMALEEFVKLPKKEYEQKRGLGKIVNFAVFYGATFRTVARQAGISEDVAEQMLKNFVKIHQVLFDWIDQCHAYSRKNGFTTTWFGRKRWLKKFYEQGKQHGQGGWAKFADRSAVNTCIQGTAAEVTRIAIVRVARALKKAGFTTAEVKLIIQLHDDLTYAIRDDMLEKVIPIIAEGMRMNVKGWEVQLDVEAKKGKIWGAQKKMKDLPPRKPPEWELQQAA